MATRSATGVLSAGSPLGLRFAVNSLLRYIFSMVNCLHFYKNKNREHANAPLLKPKLKILTYSPRINPGDSNVIEVCLPEQVLQLLL